MVVVAGLALSGCGDLLKNKKISRRVATDAKQNPGASEQNPIEVEEVAEKEPSLEEAEEPEAPSDALVSADIDWLGEENRGTATLRWVSLD